MAKAKKLAGKTLARPKAEPGWLDAGGGVQLGIREGSLVARKAGKDLASVPKAAKESQVGERLGSAIDFLEDHARSCLHSVETWMLRSLPVPRGVLQAVIADAAWAAALKDVWVVAVAPDGTIDREVGGFFRGADAAKGIGVVDRDGETSWLQTESVLVPHPILLDELDDLRQMAVEIGAQQGTSQLFRETFVRPAAPAEGPGDRGREGGGGEVAHAPRLWIDPATVTQFSGGKFTMLNQVTGLAKRLGYRVSAGSAVCRVLEHGRFVEARYELGEGDGMDETETGDLAWVDDKQRPLAIANVPPVAFSEGMRMASQIYAKRKLDEGDDDD
jgi:hypothetical protein